MAGEKIMVVEDSPTNQKLMLTLLEMEGYDARAADSAEDGFKLLEVFNPDLILMDIQLPGIDGLEMTRQLRSDPTYQDTPILAVTAYSSRSDWKKALDAGCDEFITKPIDTRSLPDVIAGYCERTRTGDE